MSDTQLERSVLEAKERDELFAIADALGAKPAARAKKSDLITQILKATGIEPDAAETPSSSRRAGTASSVAATTKSGGGSDNADADGVAVPDGNGEVTTEERPRRPRTRRSAPSAAASAPPAGSTGASDTASAGGPGASGDDDAVALAPEAALPGAAPEVESPVRGAGNARRAAPARTREEPAADDRAGGTDGDGTASSTDSLQAAAAPEVSGRSGVNGAEPAAEPAASRRGPIANSAETTAPRRGPIANSAETTAPRRGPIANSAETTAPRRGPVTTSSDDQADGSGDSTQGQVGVGAEPGNRRNRRRRGRDRFDRGRAGPARAEPSRPSTPASPSLSPGTSTSATRVTASCGRPGSSPVPATSTSRSARSAALPCARATTWKGRPGRRAATKSTRLSCASTRCPASPPTRPGSGPGSRT